MPWKHWVTNRLSCILFQMTLFSFIPKTSTLIKLMDHRSRSWGRTGKAAVIRITCGCDLHEHKRLERTCNTKGATMKVRSEAKRCFEASHLNSSESKLWDTFQLLCASSMNESTIRPEWTDRTVWAYLSLCKHGNLGNKTMSIVQVGSAKARFLD